MVESVTVVGISRDAIFLCVQCFRANSLALVGATFSDPLPYLGMKDEHSTTQSVAELA